MVHAALFNQNVSKLCGPMQAGFRKQLERR